jgi:hypothetical protein
MGAATSAPAVSRALEDAIEALGGEHSKDVSELVDVFERTEGRKEDTGPAGVDLGTSARDIVDSSRRRLKNATELGDVFELPDAVAAALFHRILAVNSTRRATTIQVRATTMSLPHHTPRSPSRTASCTSPCARRNRARRSRRPTPYSGAAVPSPTSRRSRWTTTTTTKTRGARSWRRYRGTSPDPRRN